jgi:hypothetical protein
MIPDLIRTKISKIVPPSKKMLLFNIEGAGGLIRTFDNIQTPSLPPLGEKDFSENR